MAGQFTLPKEFALCVAGALYATLLLFSEPERRFIDIDGPLLAALAWGALLAGTTAVNVDQAWRAIGYFSAGTSSFIFARRVATDGRAALLAWLTVALLLALTMAVLAEAYGLVPFFSEPGRRPGAMLGNRNVVAHLLCLGLPLQWSEASRSVKSYSRIVLVLSLAASGAVLVLSRSRGAWLTAVALILSMPAVWAVIRRPRTYRFFRVAGGNWILPMLIGSVAAIALPNQMRWERHDFANSARQLLEHETGTGLGRLIQARTTWRMIVATPLGSGPGNWSVIYPAYADTDDPSYTPFAALPAPRIARNDLLSLTAEFGLPALGAVMLTLAAILRRVSAMLWSSRGRDRTAGQLLLFVCIATMLTGVVDPVLNLPTTLALSSLLFGVALADMPQHVAVGVEAKKWHGRALRVAIALLGAGAIFCAVDTLRDTAALQILRTMTSSQDVARAAAVAPNNFEIQLTLAKILIEKQQCDLAIPHLIRAASLQPYALSVDRLRAVCRELDTPSRRRLTFPP